MGSSPTQGTFFKHDSATWSSIIRKEFYLQFVNVQNTSSFYGVFISITWCSKKWRQHDVIKNVSFKVDKRIKPIGSLLACRGGHIVHNVVSKLYWNPKFRRNWYRLYRQRVCSSLLVLSGAQLVVARNLNRPNLN